MSCRGISSLGIKNETFLDANLEIPNLGRYTKKRNYMHLIKILFTLSITLMLFGCQRSLINEKNIESLSYEITEWVKSEKVNNTINHLFVNEKDLELWALQNPQFKDELAELGGAKKFTEKLITTLPKTHKKSHQLFLKNKVDKSKFISKVSYEEHKKLKGLYKVKIRLKDPSQLKVHSITFSIMQINNNLKITKPMLILGVYIASHN